jgi:hypothetical protein
MSSVVFILGAGASKPLDAPLMDDFFNRARYLKRQGGLSAISEPDWEHLEKTIGLVQLCCAKSAINANNVEHIYTAIEMARTLGSLGTMSTDELDRSEQVLRRVIAQTLIDSMKFPIRRNNDGNQYFTEVPGYEAIVMAAKKLIDTRRAREVGFVTFNYDVALEIALSRNNMPFSYCFADEKPASSPYGVMHLHGCLGWRDDPESGTITALISPGQFVSTGAALRPGARDSVALDQLFPEVRTGTPFIVPPSEQKSELRRKILPVWRHAAELLRNAHAIAVIGFSLPYTDTFFRDFFAVSALGRIILERFVVIDPSTETAARMRGLLNDNVARSSFVACDRKLQDISSEKIVNLIVNGSLGVN